MTPARFKIIHYMILSALVAIGLAAWQALTAHPLLFARWVGVLLPLGLWLLVLLPLLRPHPLRAVLADPPADPERLIEALERGLDSPRAGNADTLARARFKLLGLYKVRERYGDAIGQGRSILRLSGLTHAFESQVRLEIAVCLDFLGRGDEAEAERRLADETLDDRPEGALGWLAQGKLLDKQQRYLEAAEAYQRAFDLYPLENAAVRNELMMRLVLASFNAGRSEDAARWAEQLLAQDVSEALRLSAHRMAGVAYSNLGRLDEAQRHRQRAVELAVETGEAKQVADCFASLADLQGMRGDLGRAEAICLEAMSHCPESAREALTVLAAVLRARGRLDEALARLEQAGRTGVMASAFFERRMQAVLKTWKAVYKAELGRLEEARDDLREAVSELHRDPKLGLVCEAAWVRLLALGGEREESVRRADRLLQGLEEGAQDSSTRWDCLDLLGRGLFEVGEYERARRCWERLLGMDHPPVAEPVGWYYLGECYWHSGEPTRARDAFVRAAASGIDCHHARLAERRARTLREDESSP